MGARIAAALAVVCILAGEGCRLARDRQASDSAKPAREAPTASTASVARMESPAVQPASCLSLDSLFIYTDQPAHADERTGDVSGTRVTLHRRNDAWSGTGISISGPEGTDPTLDSLTVDPTAGAIGFRMPLGFGSYWIVRGRIDCDSIWGTAHPAAALTDTTRLVLRRVSPAQ